MPDTQTKSIYFSTTRREAGEQFSHALQKKFSEIDRCRPMVFLCIGSDRATGDSLGPLVGQKLTDGLSYAGSGYSHSGLSGFSGIRMTQASRNIFYQSGHALTGTKKQGRKKTAVYGTLHQTVHAGNLANTLTEINNRHENPYIIAIDASLGVPEHIGCVTLGNGSLRPGIGVSHILPEAGNIHITGIVNHSGKNNHMTLQTTKLLTVIELAGFIADGILDALHVSTALQRPQKSHFINIF